MRKDIAVALRQKADEVAAKYSHSSREKNYSNAIYAIDEIIPLSEYTAAVIMIKSTGKRCAFFFHYIQNGVGYWQYFIPTDSHLLGMEKFCRYKDRVEAQNFEENFK